MVTDSLQRVAVYRTVICQQSKLVLIEQSDKIKSKCQLIRMMNTPDKHWSSLQPDRHIVIVVEMQLAWLQLQFAVVHPGVPSANLRAVLDSSRDRFCVWSAIVVYYNHWAVPPFVIQSNFKPAVWSYRMVVKQCRFKTWDSAKSTKAKQTITVKLGWIHVVTLNACRLRRHVFRDGEETFFSKY